MVASRFRLEDLLDERGGARFWRATDLTLARNVAIHVLPAQDHRAGAVLTAARTSATVSEPHLLRVLDAVEEDDVVHVVHEWGTGVSLDRMVAEGPLDARRAAWLVREVAQAIAVTHAQGVAHGRLLPENVLVSDSGSVKLIGFVVDSVLYGPRLAEIDDDPWGEHENDVRNLGALLYTALVGRWPGVPASVVQSAPLDHGHVCWPRQVRAGVPRELDTLCGSLLRDDPDGAGPAHDGPDGHATAAGVAQALSHFLGEDAPHALSGLGALHALLPPDGRRGAAGGARRAGDPGDPEATQASPLVSPTASPEATQASPLARPDARPDRAEQEDAAETTQAVPVDPPPSGSSPPASPGAPPSPAVREHTPAATAPPRPPWRGMGAGEAPADWGPEHDTGSLPVYEGPAERPGTNWLRLGAALAGLLLLALAVVVVAGLGGRDFVPGGSEENPDEGTSADALQPVEVASVSDFDPDQEGGTPEENPDLVPLATDGRAGTAWRTSVYFDGPPLAPYKDGVGLLLDLGEEQEVGDVVARLPGQGYDVQLLAADEGSGEPTSTEGLTAVAEESGVGGRVTLAPESPVTTRYLVLWLTALPRVGDGYQGRVAEVVVRS